MRWKKTCYGYKDGRLRFPGGGWGLGGDGQSVEIGHGLFSNSRRFTACFLNKHVTQTGTINLIYQEIE